MNKIENLIGERVKNSNFSFSNGLNITISSEKFEGCSLKRTNLKSSKLHKDIFYQCAFTGSRFDDTLFKQCTVQYVNFQFSTFNDCTFEKFMKKKILLGNNFDHCYFYKTKFEKVMFCGCSMSCSNFIECEFIECTFYATTLECTVFDNCLFSNVNMSELNIEFSHFNNCRLNKIELPYTQIPYIIGFSEFSKNEEIFVTADNKKFNFEEYQEQFENLITYYRSVNEFFPIANIILFQENEEDAYEILQNELKKCLISSDYRMVKHICRLATINDRINPSKIKMLFSEVKEHLGKLDNNTQTIECLKNLDEIRRLTMDAKYNKNALKIIVETDIASNDLSGINTLVNEIETIISTTLPNGYSKSIELRHNSPYEIFIQLCQNIDEIQRMVDVFFEALPIMDAGLSVVCSSILLKDRIKSKRAQKKQSKQDSRIKKITIIIE